MRRVCVSRAWKRARMLQGAVAPSPRGPPAAGPLFQGIVYLANLQLTGAGGPWAILPADLTTVQEYLGRIVGPISKYAGQYGPVNLVAGRVLPPFTVAVTDAQYSDSQLQSWINQMAQGNGLSAGSAVLVLNPPGVVNQDAKESSSRKPSVTKSPR
jgi:hypothetical protein